MALTISAAALILIGALLAVFVTGHAWIGFCLLFLGAVILAFQALFRLRKKHRKAGSVLLITLTVLLCIGGGYFSAVECAVLSGSRADDSLVPQYIIVLGAGVNGSEPSLSLMDRLNAALPYLEEHPEVKAVVSGCQGDGEEISEADCMASYLEKQGIAPERVLREEQAGSTYENFTCSLALIQEDCGFVPETVGVVTAEYHMYRARLIARSLGEEIVAIPAKTSLPTMMVNYLIREAFAVTRFYVFGR